MKIKNDKQLRANRREIDRLLYRFLTPGGMGRNAGATEAALDRRLAADRDYYLRSAA